MKIPAFLKQKSFYIPALFVVFFGLLIALRSGRHATVPQSVAVERADLVQEVTVSGTVKATSAVELAFERSGRVRSVNVNVGDRAYAGQVLLSLENGVEAAAVEDAKAKLASKQARHSELKAGGRPEEVSVKESQLSKARADLATDYSAVATVLLDAFNKADNAVHTDADTLFNNPSSTEPRLNFRSSDTQAVVDAETGRSVVESALANFKTKTANPLQTDAEKEKALSDVKEPLLVINDFLQKTNKALDAALNLSASALATDKDSLASARNAVSTALTNVNDQIQTIATQKITVQTAASELALTEAPATAETLLGAQADVRSAEAAVANAEATLYKTYIVSPIAGIVTRQDAKRGEIAAGNTALIAVASDSFKLEALVPEVDVSKLAIGNRATVTLDAYGSDIFFPARVIAINPAETVVDGVSTYKTTLEFGNDDPRIRSGMTANITVGTATRAGVLTVPTRAVYEKGGKKYVKVLVGAGTEERAVTTGLRGSDGKIEITSGLSEGEKIVLSPK